MVILEKRRQFESRWKIWKCWSILIAAAFTTVALAEPVHLDRKGEKWAASTLRKMSLEEKIGQLIMPWARIEFENVNGPKYLLLREEMDKYHVGGFGVTVFVDNGALMKSEPLEAAALTNNLQKDSKYPLLFAADFERGLAMRLSGSTAFPAAMAFGATGDKDFSTQFGRITAREARAVGVQWNWFPVADVNSNPANPIINTRSFGEDPAQVAEMVSAYIIGARSEGLLTTVKHFPGHGDTDTDSHLTLARVHVGLDRLNTVELVPFRAAIAAGVDSVMMAHITVPAIEPNPDLPASISKKVVTGLLKEQLGFKGLVITDALDMGALMQAFPGNATQVSAAEAVAAIQAGNDMVIIPADLGGAYNGLLEAVKSGTIPERRIDESVLKILRVKASVGLNRKRTVDLAAVTEEVGRPENIAVAQKIADRSVTLVKDTHGLLPLRTTVPSKVATGSAQAGADMVAVVFSDDARTSEGGRAFIRQLRERAPAATVFSIDRDNAAYMSPQVMAAVKSAQIVIAVAEAVPVARRTTSAQKGGSAALDQGADVLLRSILQSAGGRTVLAALGNPYIGSGLPDVETYLCTFSDSAISAASLTSALFGEIPIQGRSPVSIPGLIQRGGGLDRVATQAAENPQ
jgi:beta-N-acetylhexosaminidase